MNPTSDFGMVQKLYRYGNGKFRGQKPPRHIEQLTYSAVWQLTSGLFRLYWKYGN